MVVLHEDFFEDFGFILDTEKMCFSKKLPQAKQLIFLNYTQQTQVNLLEYQVGIRIDDVEMIINQFLPSLGNYRERSITHLETLDNINSDFPRRFLVENKLEIAAVKEKIDEFFIKEGFHWLDQYSIPSVLERYFNRVPEQNINTQNFTYRSARGVTMSKLYNPEEYINVKNFYLAKLEVMQETPFTLASFLNLLDYLENI